MLGNAAIKGSLMEDLSTPIRYGLIGAVAGLLGFGLSMALGLDLEAPWWLLMLAGGIGGYVGGYFKEKRRSR
ncbi:hypothetical protein [Afifella pfennigii]|uniref:hypothetical protein n=1 Tax=Afifella pfennigii TaxID=209897 RepID=UPI00047BE290|nr:hypothetical protein [Afifella pfennigii]